MEFSYIVKIPKERIAVLVGEKGKTKKKIEKAFEIKIIVDSREGDVALEGDDGINLMGEQNVVKEIGRGFNPDYAIDLSNEDKYLEIIDITEYSRNSKKNLIRLRSRAIGTGGKARTTIERLTDTHISVYGKTISIIGSYEDVALARRAFESILNGSRHSTVYAMLEKKKKSRVQHNL